jgi:hypothetical protein
MTSTKFAAAALAVLLSAGLSAPVSAQGVIDGGLSSRQVTNPEAETIEAETSISRSGFQLFGYTLAWNRSVWISGSSIQLPALFVIPGDRRWGIQ